MRPASKNLKNNDPGVGTGAGNVRWPDTGERTASLEWPASLPFVLLFVITGHGSRGRA